MGNLFWFCNVLLPAQLRYCQWMFKFACFAHLRINAVFPRCYWLLLFVLSNHVQSHILFQITNGYLYYFDYPLFFILFLSDSDTSVPLLKFIPNAIKWGHFEMNLEVQQQQQQPQKETTHTKNKEVLREKKLTNDNNNPHQFNRSQNCSNKIYQLIWI